MSACGLAGCGGGEARKTDYATQSREVLGTASRPGTNPWDGFEGNASAHASAEESSWTIALAVASPTDAAGAQQALARAREHGLAGARLESRRNGWVVAYGRYDAPDSPAARRDLAMVKGLVAGEVRPYAGALMLPPERKAESGTLPELDLRNARRLFGTQAKYTLQINAYARADGSKPSASELAEFRRLAEQSAQELRRQGERAFYYHGPNMSLVTVGLFTDADLGGTDFDELGRSVPRPESMALQEARRKFPHMLLNGRGLRVRSPGGGEGALARSELVQVPER